jgi:putative zinc finger/helix-turn-helix YgiT family protein
MKKTNAEIDSVENECPDCGAREVKTRIVKERFEYGNGTKAVTLEASIPYRRCEKCNFEYTDYEAEDVRHEAVCRHLGVMTPAEIVSLRRGYGLSRAQFAEVTRIGEASLARWETAELIQNAANDDYLYLLSFPANLKLLRERREAASAEHVNDTVQQRRAKFRVLDGADLERKRREEATFELRPAA